MTLQLPGYRDFELIGQGGLGRVYRGVRESTGGLVAVKELRDIAEASPAWHRARRELDAMLRLKGHPYVVSVEEIVEGSDGPCLVMEYVPGGSLMDRLAYGVLTPPEIVLVGQQMSQALMAAHQVGMVHRDVKPHNVLVGQFGQVKVCDFGIAALARGAGLQTQTQALTLGYASPEALDGDAPVGPPADVFSFGATMVHLMTGKKPSMQDRLGGGKLELQTADPALGSVVTLLNACLAHRPEDRPTMAAVATAFERAAIDLGGRRITALAAAGSLDDRTVVRTPVTQITVTHAPAAVAHPLGNVPPMISAPPLVSGSFGAQPTVVHPTMQQPISQQQPVVPMIVQMQQPPRRTSGAAAALWGVLAAGVVLAIVAVVVLTRPGGDSAVGQAPAATPPATAAPLVTVAPTTAAPLPTAPPETAAPATVPPITAAPVTAPPATAPPATAPPATAPPVTPPPVVLLPYDLGLATPMTQPICDGSYVTMVGAATNPATYAAVVQVVLDQYPGSAYMHTLSTCSSLTPRTKDGSMIYSVYFGPYRTLSEACDARRFGPKDAYIRVLDNITPPTALTSCG